jgi:NAD(P)-dependent dehydrogenase (short-subunit alcohol dehydrogenase family)
MGGNKNLAGKVALVTGGSRGVGAAIGRRLASDGAYVVLAARSRETGDAVVADIKSKGGQAEFRVLDVTDENQWLELVASIEENQRGLHALVNNAGVHQIRSFGATSDEIVHPAPGSIGQQGGPGKDHQHVIGRGFVTDRAPGALQHDQGWVGFDDQIGSDGSGS